MPKTIRPSPRHMRARLALAAILVSSLHVACVNNENIFTDGRLEKPCNQSIPICDRQAICTIKNDDYYSGEFPGGMRVIVPSELQEARLVVRFLLDDLVYPGTELLVEAHNPSCGDFEEAHPKDVDLFEFAGDDRTIEFQLDLPGRGDHLVEVFSDMSAAFLMTLEVEEK